MDEIPPSSLDGVEIKVSADRMAVTLIVQQGAKVTAADVIAKIREAKISRFDDGMVIEAIDQSKNTKASVEVATGVLPVGRSRRASRFSCAVLAGFFGGHHQGGDRADRCVHHPRW